MKIDKKLKNNLFVFVALFVLSSFLFGNFASATLESAVGSTIGYVIEIFVNLFGQLLMVLIWILIKVAQYDNFIKSPAVTTGWVIIRDICNMFFILILLVISFATLLKLENYNVKKLLPKLLIMAVLINFSKTICGVLIDASQIVMLTFVNAFKEVGGGNLAELLGIDKYLSLDDNLEGTASLMKIVGSYILSLIYVIISVMVIFVMISVLIVRIVMLWIYIVLSPIAYLGSAFPSGQKYASMWWEEFTKNLVVGPVVAFFIWLSFAIASTTPQDLISQPEPGDIVKTDNDEHAPSAALTEGGVPENMIKFMIAIAMLMGGLMAAQKAGGMAGSMASGAISKIHSAGAAPLRKTADWAKAGAVGAGVVAVGATLGTAKSLDNFAGKKIIRKEGGLVGNVYGAIRNTPGNMAKGIKQMVAGNSEVNKALHGYYFDKKRNPQDAKLKWGGYDDWKEDEKGNFYRTYKDSKTNEQKTAYADHAGKKLSAWNDLRASTYEGFSSANSGARATANKAQEEKINEYKKKISDGNLTASEKLQRLSSNTASSNEKMALAIDLAENGDFKKHDDVEVARKAIGDNPLLLKKFNDEVDKNQAHLGYDLSTQAGIEDFKNRVDAGKIDTTKLDSDAYKEKKVIKILQEYHGKDFGRVMESAFKRGKKYETAVTDGLAEHANTEGLLKDGDINPVRKALAKLTGDIGQALRGLDLSKDEVRKQAETAIGSMLQGFSTKDLAKLSLDNFNPDKMKKHFKDDINQANRAVGLIGAAIGESINNSTLTSIKKQSDVNKKLVDEIEGCVNKRETEIAKEQKDKVAKETEPIVKEYSKYSKI